jgi:peroxiredoxin
MSKVYIKLFIILMFFFSRLSLAAEKIDSDIDLPDAFELIKTPVNLPLSSVFYNQKEEKVSLENFDNRFIIVHFWASWSMDCEIELVALNNLQKEFRKKALLVLAISEDFKAVDTVDRYFTKHKIDYLDIYMDKKSRVYNKLMINHLPATYLIDFNGKVIARSKPNKVVNWNDQDIKDYLEEKVSQYNLLPPEYKNTREEYKELKKMNKGIKKNKKDVKVMKKNKLFIN